MCAAREYSAGMSIAIRSWVEQNVGLDVFCLCGKAGHLTAADAAARFDLDQTYDQVAQRFTCSSCGSSGPPKVSVRFSIGDYYDNVRANGGNVPQRLGGQP